MKITKYHQSCLLVEIKDKRILVDPGEIGYTKKVLEKEWTDIDYILVSHFHSDHCNEEAINQIIKRDKANLYTTKEVEEHYDFISVNTIKEGDILVFDEIEIEVTKAVHGFITSMKETHDEVKENVGFMIYDNEYRLYYTSDTINFNHNYKCDILCMPFNGNGLTLGLVDGTMFLKDIDPKLVIPVNYETPLKIMRPSMKKLTNLLEKESINCSILKNNETIEITKDILRKNILK